MTDNGNNRRRDALELVCIANDALRAAGFVVANVSMKSEATYWRLPGRHGLIRVASHRSRERNLNSMQGVLARITFRGGRSNRGQVWISDERLDSQIALAIGVYILRSSGYQLSTYEPHPTAKPRLIEEVT